MSVFPSFLQPKLSFSDTRGMAQFEPQCSPAQIPTYPRNQTRRGKNKQIVAMCSCFNPFLSLGKVSWLAGSLLIIGLASVVNPTIGWRWLIRIASIPGILLILVFKVGRARLPPPRHGPGISPGTKRHCPPPPASLGLSLCFPFTTAALSPRGLGTVLMAWGGCRPAAGETSACGRWLGFALLLQSLWLCCPAVSLQHPRDKVIGQASRRRQARQGIEKNHK